MNGERKETVNCDTCIYYDDEKAVVLLLMVANMNRKHPKDIFQSVNK